MSIVFLAISRTGSDPLRHDMFEVAALHRVTDGDKLVERAHHWSIRPERLGAADTDELLRTRYYDRMGAWAHNDAPVVAIDPTLGTTSPTSHGAVARTLAKMLLGNQLATFGIDREAEFLGEFLRSQREPCGWVGHLDVTAAAAGATAGYSQGWCARGRYDVAAPASSSVDLTAALLPFDPFRLAVAIGAAPAADPCSALARAYMVRDMWAIVSSPLRHGEPEPPAGVHALGDAQAPTVAMAGAPAEASPFPTTGDPELDKVIAHIADPDDRDG